MRLFNGLNFRILILSVWMLFLELFLIRWISAEIPIFAYVSNLVLLACFIGIGAGCYFSNKKSSIWLSFLMLTVIALAVKSIPFKIITDLLGGFGDSLIWHNALAPRNFIPVLQGISLTLLMFGMVALTFFPLGQLLAKMLASHNKIIIAYSINIAGSVIGIWLFSLLSFIYTTPLIWLALSMLCGLFFIEKKPAGILLFLLLIVSSFVIISIPANSASLTLWTPYQKLDVYNIRHGNVDIGYRVDVNNANYMELLNISPDFINSNLGLFGSNISDAVRFGQYDIPYMFKEKIEDVLIVGAGAGNDAAGALRNGIKNIDAVEIDPGIYRLGSMLHPEHPYEGGRVNMYIDDARSFFKKAKKKYDIVSFGLLDSHALSSSYNNIRPDHYIYTIESFKEAKDLLKDDGIMTVAFAATRHWIAIRLRDVIKEVFGEDPVYFVIRPYGNVAFNRGWVMYVIANDMSALKEKIKTHSELSDYIKNNSIDFVGEKVKLTTDDWPYLYVKEPVIPIMHLCIIASLLILLAISGMGLFSSGEHLNLHFLFLGAGFLLLEFQNISKASLLFGSTWLVNAYMISAILVLILLANFVTHYFKIKNIKPFYYLLWISILIIYLIPLSNLNIYNYYVKGTLVAIFLNIPIFFAGVIFITSFRDCQRKDIALGSNLLGAGIGGLLESVSFIYGIRSLLLLVLCFYAFSYIFRARISVKAGRG
ncbi:MAG: hypothetical protein KJ706_08770 [Candidatus Omnitrophica bacterium]|nr:hypothetical protein [Candidatus Omnitrophota bacterium]MBU4590134.1 hypothetical protein [Candidatus Omnitrophota bacterium]